jgi:hypothetical protein
MGGDETQQGFNPLRWRWPAPPGRVRCECVALQWELVSPSAYLGDRLISQHNFDVETSHCWITPRKATVPLSEFLRRDS